MKTEESKTKSKNQTTAKPKRSAATKKLKAAEAIEAIGSIGAKDALEAINSITSIASIREKIAPKKSIIEKEQVWTTDERNNFKRTVQQILKRKDSDFEIKGEIEQLLSCLQDYSLKEHRMPEAIESHAEISELDNTINLAAYGLKPARGNWIICDLGSKQKNECLIEALKEMGLEHNSRLVLPSLSAIGFIANVGNILNLMISEGPERTKAASKRITNHAKLLCYACMAYIEIIEEQAKQPCPDVDEATQTSHRFTRVPNSPISWLKKELLKQTYTNKDEKDLNSITDEEIKNKINFNGAGDLNNHEAIAITCRISEELLIPLKQKRKRETLFKLRAILASRIFEEVKKYRKGELSQLDHVLPEKPRYKTGCLWFVKHAKDLPPEVIPVETSTNLYYWGNPNSEKDLHAIVPLVTRKRQWTFKKEDLKTTLVENQSWLSWFAVGVLSLILAAGLKSEGSKRQEDKINDARQSQETKVQVIKRDDVEP
jgi:hypothetical protein